MDENREKEILKHFYNENKFPPQNRLQGIQANLSILLELFKYENELSNKQISQMISKYISDILYEK